MRNTKNFSECSLLLSASHENPLKIPVSDRVWQASVCVREVAEETGHQDRSVERKNIMMMVGGGEV